MSPPIETDETNAIDFNDWLFMEDKSNRERFEACPLDFKLYKMMPGQKVSKMNSVLKFIRDNSYDYGVHGYMLNRRNKGWEWFCNDPQQKSHVFHVCAELDQLTEPKDGFPLAQARSACKQHIETHGPMTDKERDVYKKLASKALNERIDLMVAGFIYFDKWLYHKYKTVGPPNVFDEELEDDERYKNSRVYRCVCEHTWYYSLLHLIYFVGRYPRQERYHRFVEEIRPAFKEYLKMPKDQQQAILKGAGSPSCKGVWFHISATGNTSEALRPVYESPFISYKQNTYCPIEEQEVMPMALWAPKRTQGDAKEGPYKDLTSIPEYKCRCSFSLGSHGGYCLNCIAPNWKVVLDHNDT
ncbi:hypothetical protein M011DRAFT_528430 [Sporormia fimetaria CBS 119925]|uniref:Uncharacterized protein n=1 Tax=Sporormia fimetaria CBS 119925 TaxID=1340428 RepID=A0A6A6V573_9PLEO|nr:hypothetical protein M011DRAFT_528430 [Sporormia fimetaria CBS 119925]